MKISYMKMASKAEAYDAVKGAITPELIAKFKVTAELFYEEDKIWAKGKGFKLEMDFFDDYCEVGVDLSFILKPLKKKILSGVEAQLKRVI